MAIANGALEDFLRRAIELASQDQDAVRELGCSASQVEVLENGDVHAYLSDGSRFYVTLHHMVPRGYGAGRLG